MNATNRKQAVRPFSTAVGAVLSAAAIAVLLVGSAQVAVAEGPIQISTPIGPVSPFVGNGYVAGGGYPYRATTPAESFARGTAAIIRAQGEYNRLTSEAAINAEVARAKAIVNSEEAVKTYIKRRQLNRDYRRSLRGDRPTQEDLERYARQARPTPLSPSELDPLTGRVSWPILLRADYFAPQREAMEELLDRWAVSHNLGADDGFGTDEHLTFRRMVDYLNDELQKYIRDLPPQDYIAAKRFLRSLEYQVTQPETASGTSLASME